jgi:translocation and assembly module TamB
MVTLPDNTIIINGQKTTTPQRYKYNLNLDVALTHEIKINSDNLIAQLTGKLNVKHSSLQPITATGELNITNGTYNAYGQPLKITTGDLLFTGGPVNNPRLNIQATKTLNVYSRPGTKTQFKPDQTFRSTASMQRLTVGVQATGTLQHPKLKLFSQPSGLSDTDILSYMMLGTTSNQATASQTQMLFQTAQLMGVGGTNAAGGLQRIFGLTDFGVEQEEVLLAAGEKPTQEQMFGIGKYITPRLYLHYSIGISNPISILNLTYYLTHQFAIQTQTSSVDRAADIFYTFETD